MNQISSTVPYQMKGKMPPYISLPLLLSVPLLNPRSPLLAPFPPQHGAPASAPVPPRTPVPSPPTTTVSLIPVSTRSLPIPTIITIQIIPIISPMPRAQTPAPAPAPADPIPTVPPEEFPPQLPPNQLHVHEIAVPTSVAVVLFELPARSLAEIGDRREIGYNRPARVEPALQSLQGGGGLVLLLELDVDVADHVVGEIVADVEALHLAELVKLLEDVLVEGLEVLLDLARVDGLALGVHAGGDHVRPLVHVGEEDRRRDRGPVVEARAPISVAARSNLEVERTVDAVLLGAEDRCQVLRHGSFIRLRGWIVIRVFKGDPVEWEIEGGNGDV
jgi:hypothetical protein